MKFKKYLRFHDPYWFSGVYKICRYENTERGTKYKYYAYYILEHSWGDCVDKSKKEHGYPTLKAAMDACEVHAKNNPDFATNKRKLIIAEAARQRWLGIEGAL